jgi:hypothetical protein
MPEDEVEETDENQVDGDILEIISDEDGNEILRTSSDGTVIYDEDEDDDSEEIPTEIEAEEPPVPEVPATEPDRNPTPAEDLRADDSTEDGGVLPEAPKYNGFSVRPDGLGIYEKAFEDANSPEAELLIYGEIDEETGEVVSAGIGEREYYRRCGAYESSKVQYAAKMEGEIHTVLQRAVSDLQQESASLFPSLAKKFNVTEEDAQEFKPIYDRAIELIDQERQNRANAYANAGYPGEMCYLLANRDVLSVKGVLNMAFKSAAMELEDTYDEIKWRLREKGKGNPAPVKAEPVKQEERLTPPVTTTTSVPVRQAPSKAEKVDLRGIPRAALEIAKQCKIDPRKLMEN